MNPNLHTWDFIEKAQFREVYLALEIAEQFDRFSSLLALAAFLHQYMNCTSIADVANSKRPLLFTV